MCSDQHVKYRIPCGFSLTSSLLLDYHVKQHIHVHTRTHSHTQIHYISKLYYVRTSSYWYQDFILWANRANYSKYPTKHATKWCSGKIPRVHGGHCGSRRFELGPYIYGKTSLMAAVIDRVFQWSTLFLLLWNLCNFGISNRCLLFILYSDWLKKQIILWMSKLANSLVCLKMASRCRVNNFSRW